MNLSNNCVSLVHFDEVYPSLNEREKRTRVLSRGKRATPMGIPSKSRESSFLGDPSALTTTTTSNDRSIG